MDVGLSFASQCLFQISFLLQTSFIFFSFELLFPGDDHQDLCNFIKLLAVLINCICT